MRRSCIGTKDLMGDGFMRGAIILTFFIEWQMAEKGVMSLSILCMRGD
jgi:hypothetical protein